MHNDGVVPLTPQKGNKSWQCFIWFSIKKIILYRSSFL